MCAVLPQGRGKTVLFHIFWFSLYLKNIIIYAYISWLNTCIVIVSVFLPNIMIIGWIFLTWDQFFLSYAILPRLPLCLGEVRYFGSGNGLAITYTNAEVLPNLIEILIRIQSISYIKVTHFIFRLPNTDHIAQVWVYLWQTIVWWISMGCLFIDWQRTPFTHMD